MAKILIVAMDFYRMSVFAIQTWLEIHTKSADRLKEIRAQIQNAESEPNASKQMAVSTVFVQSALPAIRSLNAETLTNVWKIHAALIQFVSTRLEAMTANVSVDSSEIHLQCVHQFKLMPNATIQTIVHAVNQ